MKCVEVIVSAGSSNTILAIAEKVKAQDVRLGVVGEDGKLWTRLLVSDNKLQALLDILQNVLGAQAHRKCCGIAGRVLAAQA